jgi:hypothetical protein
MRRTAAIVSLLAMSSAMMPAAFAQGWDDAASVQQAAESQANQPKQVSPQDAYTAAVEAARRKNEERIQLVRQRTGQINSPMEQLLRDGMDNPLVNGGYVDDGSVKYKMEQGPDGNMQVVQDKRGEMPDYANGFGQFNPAQKEQPEPGQMTTLTPELVRAMQERAGKVSPSKNPMFDKADSTGFFGGMTPPKEAVTIDASELKTRHSDGQPAWAKDRLNKVHQYVDGQEHHGAEDPHGFF